MDVFKTDLTDVWLIKPKVFKDHRGLFFESFKQEQVQKLIPNLTFVQDNHSQSDQKGTLRGLHFQTAPYAQTKLIHVVQGKIWDVIVDIRPSSPQFGKWTSTELSAENSMQVLIPQGFAHGFITLTDNSITLYKVDSVYSKEHAKVISWNDPQLKIDWPLQPAVLSEQDQSAPTLEQVQNSGLLEELTNS